MSEVRTFEFTDKALKGLSIPPKPRQFDYFDKKGKGFGIRVSYGGRKTFFVMYNNASGVRQRTTLKEFGRLEDGKLSLAAGRQAAAVKLGEIAKGEDPAAKARTQRQAPTVEVLAADFIKMQRKGKKKSVDRQEKLLARDVLPAIGGMKAREVERDDIRAIMDTITDRGAPVMANRVHEVVRAMFNYALEEEKTYRLEHNPADHMKRHRNPEQGRERWLSLDEIERYWRALDKERPEPADALRLCLLTAARQSNVLGMRLDQLSLDDKLWTCPASTTKTDKTYQVPLSQMAVEIIRGRITALEEAERVRAKRQRRELRPVTWIFPARGDSPSGLDFTGKPHRAACERAEIKDYPAHDHRHTFATHCEQMGIPRLIWDGIMGHTNNGMADLYSGHDFAKERLACMERWADRIQAAVSENVVNLDDKRA